MKEEFELDSRDIVILQELSKTMKGMGFNELQREIGFPRNTVTRHLKTLVKEGIVSRKQLGKSPNSPVLYNAVISDGLRSMTQLGLEVAINLADIDFEKMTKVQLVSMIPHLMTGIAIYQTIWMDDYITHDITRAEFQYATKLISNFIDELRPIFEKLLSAKDYRRLKDEAWTVYANESERAAHITWWAKDYTKKYRTVHEIVRDLESLFARTDSHGNYTAGGEIPHHRYQVERNKKMKEESRKIEAEYTKLRNQLADLQSKLKDAPVSHIGLDKE